GEIDGKELPLEVGHGDPCHGRGRQRQPEEDPSRGRGARATWVQETGVHTVCEAAYHGPTSEGVVERTVRRSSRLPGRSGVRAQGPAHLEQAFTQHGALRGEIPLVLHVGGLALGRFDLDRFIPPLTQVVRRGTHVQGPYLTGQGEAVRDQLRGCRRDELVGPLVQIHG